MSYARHLFNFTLFVTDQNTTQPFPAGLFDDDGITYGHYDDGGMDTNRQTITFTVIFLILMFLYIGFCYHYRKVKITWISRSSTDTAEDRARRARDNAAVLIESTTAAERVVGDEEEERRLSERKSRIDGVLLSRLIVENEESGVEEGTGLAQYEQTVKSSDIADENVLAKDDKGDKDAPSNTETTIDSVPSSSEVVTILSNDETMSNNDIQLSTLTTTPSSTITLSQIQQTYSTECNICLSAFQIGQSAAWSKHHFNGCVHVFHEDCMKRWLLVRDGCPICRRKYLVDGEVDLESGSNETVAGEG